VLFTAYSGWITLLQDVIQRHEKALLAEVEQLKSSMNVSNFADLVQAPQQNAGQYMYINIFINMF
jgi:hypothetical protein